MGRRNELVLALCNPSPRRDCQRLGKHPPFKGVPEGLMERYPSYDLRDLPTGVSDFVNTFPPKRRTEVFAAIVDLHLRREAEEEWVRREVEGMLELPDIL